MQEEELDLPNLEEDILPEEEGVPEEYDERFVNVLETRFGLTPGDLKYGIEFIKNTIAAKKIDVATTELSSVWNVDNKETNRRIGEVAKYWSKMPAEKKELYDTVEGAQIIWATIAKKKSVSTSKNSVNPSGKKVSFTQSQLDGMTQEEYAENYDKIRYAYANNLIG